MPLSAAGAAAQSQSCGAGALGGSASVVLNNLIDQLSDQTAESMTDVQKQNRLNLIGSLVAGITAAAGGEAAVAANAAQIESANNHLNDYEKIQLRDERSQYQANCGGENASADSCKGLKKSIEDLEEKGRSVLASETITPGEDFAPAQTIKIEPNDVIPCVGSSNGYCIVTDESISPEGQKEWVLKPASEEQALDGKARNAQVLADINENIKKSGGELFESGCASDPLCMVYRIGGGANPVNGNVPTAGDRLLTGIELFVMVAGAKGAAASGAKGTASALETTNPIVVSGSRAIDKAKSYESGVRGMYGNSTFEQRQFEAIIDGKVLNGVADEVAMIGGKRTAVEAKFVEDWSASLRNPTSPTGSKPWSVAEQTKMVDQAKKYSSGFEGGVVYHTNSAELASHYSKIFTEAGVTNFKFVITPVKN